MPQKKIFLAACLLLLSVMVFSQGCSDAGFCTMGAMKPDQPYNKRLKIKLRSIEFSQYYGHTHFNNKIRVSTSRRTLVWAATISSRQKSHTKSPKVTSVRSKV